MSGFKDLIRENLNPVTHSILRRNRVTETFIKEVIKDVRSIFFIGNRKHPKYVSYPMHKIYRSCRTLILFKLKRPGIRQAFKWEETVQGYNFWKNIQNQIEQELYNLR